MVRHVDRRQIRAARGLLDWSQERLALSANVRVLTIKRLENGTRPVSDASFDAVVAALEAAGVEFLADGVAGPTSVCGVALRS